jgi:hypothetical protein
MKVLLIGEFSGVHTDLANALKKRGVTVVTASHGDAFKNYPRDIDLTATGRVKFIRQLKILRNYLYLTSLIVKEKFDVIQIINPGIFPKPIDQFFINFLLSNKTKKFLLACGDDDVIWDAYRNKTYRYYAFDGMLKHDPGSKIIIWEQERTRRLSEKLRQGVQTIIPNCVEYKLAYERRYKNLPFIPLSIDVEKLPFDIASKDYSKIRILHGVNKGREGVKGTYFIKAALQKIVEKYAEKVEVIITESLPFNEYIQILKKVNVVLDQPYGYSPSMNALYSMNFGCVVFSGAEPEYLDSLNIKESPLINMLPDADDIFQKVDQLITSGKVEEKGKQSHDFVKNYHSINKNVEKYLKVWQK